MDDQTLTGRSGRASGSTHVAVVDVEDVDLSGRLHLLHSGSVPGGETGALRGGAPQKIILGLFPWGGAVGVDGREDELSEGHWGGGLPNWREASLQ